MLNAIQKLESRLIQDVQLFFVCVLLIFTCSIGITQTKTISFGQTLMDEINPPSQIKRYLINLDSGDLIFIRIAPVAGSFLRPKVQLYDPAGDLVVDASHNSIDAFHIIYRTITKGEFNILVKEISIFNKGGKFCISVDRFNKPPNAKYIRCEGSRSDSINCVAQINAYKFIVDSNSVAIIHVTPALGSEIRPKLWIVDEEGNLIKNPPEPDSVLAIGTSLSVKLPVQSNQRCLYAFVVDVFGTALGDYTITKGIITGDCEKHNIQVNPSKTKFCEGESFSIYASAPYRSSGYSWTGPNNFKAKTKNISFSNAKPNQTGYYKVSVNDAVHCSFEDSIYIEIQQAPEIQIDVKQDKTSFCAGDTFNLIPTTNATNPGFKWNGPQEYISYETNPEIIIPDIEGSGSREYILTVFDSSTGCSALTNISIEINQKPAAMIPSGDTMFVCLDNLIELDVNTNDPLNKFFWKGPHMFESMIKSNHIDSAKLFHQGSYIVTIEDSNNCKRNDTVFIDVVDINLVDTIKGDTLHAIVTGGTPPYLYTLFPDSLQNNSGIFAGLAPGDYILSVLDGNGCSTFITVRILPVNSIDLFKESKILITPNPGYGIFEVELWGEINDALFYQVYDLFGNKLIEHNTYTKKFRIDLTEFPASAYYLKFSSKNSKYYKTITIIKY